MRAGWVGNSELQRRVQRDDPDAHPIVQAVRQVAADIKDQKDDWPTGTGWEVLEAGGIRLSGSATVHADTPDQTATDNIITDLDNESPFEVVEIAWRGSNNTDRELRQVTVAVDPDVAGTGSTHNHFRCKLFRVSAEFIDGVEIQPISTHAEATASGSSAQEITFNFVAADGRAPTPGPPPIVVDDTSPVNEGVPKTWVMVWAVSSDGTPAGNVAWVGDSTSSGAEISATGTHNMRHVSATAFDASSALSLGLGTRYSLGQPGGMPRCTIQGQSLTQKTITLSGSEGIDLGSSPEADTTLEILAQGDTPADTTVTYEISDDAGSTWTQVFDKDVIGEDNTATGGADLSSVSRQQTYQMRTTLSPDTTGTVTPIVRRLGVREIEVTDTFELATVDSLSYSLDPLTLKGSIPEAKMSLAKNGITDYRDLATELFSTTDLVDIEIRLFVGHADMNQQDWLHLDTFLVDDYEGEENRLRLTGLHPMVKLRTALPPFDTSANERLELVYEGQSLKAVYSDLITAQVDLLDRRVGAVVEDASTTVSKTIEDSDGKTELDAIAYLAGGSVIGSQGKIKFTRVTGEDTSTVRAAFSRETVRVRQATPGFRARVPEFYVRFGWNEERGDFDGEVRDFHLPSLTSVGTANLDAPERLNDEVSRWIDNDGTKDSPTSALAEIVADRVPQEVGVGIPHLAFRSIVGHPYLEVGDLVAVQTDRMVLRDPTTGRDIRGVLWAVGTIIRADGAMGRDFTVWIRDYTDVVPAVNTGPRQRFVRPRVAGATLSIDTTGSVDLVGHTVQAQSVRYATSTSAFPSKTTVQISGTLLTTDADNIFEDTGIATVDFGVTLYVSILAAETAAGGGAEAATLHKVKITRGPEPISERILSMGAAVYDDGTDDTYEVQWSVSDDVTNTDHDMIIDYYSGVAKVAEVTITDPVTTTSDTHTETGDGGDPGTFHKIRLRLTDTGGNTVDRLESAVESSDTSGGSGPPVEEI